MAASNILNLNNSIAPRIIRCLYIVALILIAVMVVLGVVRGVRLMGRAPMLPPAMTDNAAPNAAAPAPDATAPQSPQPGMMGPRRMDGRRMMMQRGMRRPGMGMGMGRMGMFGMGRNPAVAGALLILFTLLRAAIVLMVVRILAEMGLAVLAMPRRSEI